MKEKVKVGINGERRNKDAEKQPIQLTIDGTLPEDPIEIVEQPNTFFCKRGRENY
ncbi:hypothetical protein J6590_065753 [Homalodisca vitripennis]|nr:hypothetical protein J6590_065753 [Homalodisca vitripennis]